LTVTESSNAGFTGHFLNVTTLLSSMDLQTPADHAPTAQDIVSAAHLIATSVDNKALAPNDCHNLATAIAASAGATLDPNSDWTGKVGDSSPPNEESGFWRIAYRGNQAGAVADWQTEVKAGDIVRMERFDGGPHTATVTAGLNADNNHPGKIQVVDNANGVIAERWVDFNDETRGASTLTKPESITIYRLTTDNVYLNDQHLDPNATSILGSNFNDLIKAGDGANTLSGGHGNDTLDGGGGDDTAVFHGKQSDYKISVSGNTATLTDLRGNSPDGADTIKNIEHVKFGDGTVVDFANLKNTPVTPTPVAGSVSIEDRTIVEGANGSHTETFTVKRTGGDAAFDVNFATKDGSATVADGDYKENHGPLHFAQGVNEQKISIVVNGDTKVEDPENFTVNLSGATNGATITKAVGTGTIGNDDATPIPVHVAGSISIGDRTITEGSNGSHIETFTVTRTGGDAAFDVRYATAAGSTSGAAGDYKATGGDLHFAAGVNEQKISIVIDGDTKVEGNETFKINLSDPTKGATIADGQAIITIKDDDVATTHHVANDFNGDGISDALFMNSSGKVALWELNGNHIDSNTSVGSVPAGWHVDGIADFNNDGKSDVLLHNDSGKVAMWQMDGNHIASNTTVGSVGADWKVIATEDFNGDGKADVLWENSQGKVAMWQMDGDHVASNTSVGSIGTDWKLIGSDDFNGDGKADILWQNSAGKIAMWQMDGDHVASNTSVGSIGSTWHAAGTGDFDADGKADILWQNDNGKVAMWQMNGDHIDSNTSVGSAAGWHVVGTGDYNHDGKADVLFENASGKVAQWQMDGDHIEQNLSVGSHSTDWHHV
jgi:Calx-beta domain/FG-GAP-like repeat/RTX calcium-binding nonapeptide repeat (4 copies)